MFGKESHAEAEAVRKDPVFAELQKDLNVTRKTILAGFVIGLATLIVLWVTGALPNGYTVFFWALACFVVGGLLGFLFGIPRVLQKGSQVEGPQPKPDAKPGVPARASYQLVVNTNLDDVSDWFTKIVIGVGLVELRKIPELVRGLATLIAGELGIKQVPFIISVLVYFSTVGFLSGYLTTRMFVQRAFRIADLYASGALDSGESRDDEPLRAGPPPLPAATPGEHTAAESY